MVLPAHHFRGHVARSPTGIAAIVGFHGSCDPQIGDPQIAHVVENQVLRFYVPMNNVVKMQKLQPHQNASNEKLSLGLTKPPPHSHMVTKIPSHKQVHHEV